MNNNPPALVCDLDGSLLKTDCLHEVLAGLLVRTPWRLMGLLWTLRRGRAAFKNALSARYSISTLQLPLNERVLSFVSEQKQLGREVYLCTASPQRWADEINDRLNGLFIEAWGSGTTLLTGEAKAAFLVSRFGVGGFDYLGDAKADLPVWQVARVALVAGQSNSVWQAVQAMKADVVDLRAPETATWPRKLLWWLTQMRVMQWAKNALLLVPLGASHKLLEMPAVLAAMTAFLAFCLAASANYILKDLADVAHDRAHPINRERPIAAGRISPLWALTGSVLMLLTAVLLSLAVGLGFLAALLGYLLVAAWYSGQLKRIVVIDVVVLAGFYVWRIVAGTIAIGIGHSFWLLASALFFFFSLAVAKRFAELRSFARLGRAPAGRAYTLADQDILRTVGIAASTATCVLLSLYIQSPDAQRLYPNLMWLWGLPVLTLYWQMRIWLWADRGQLPQDPVLFAIKDPVSLSVAGIGAGLLLCARFF